MLEENFNELKELLKEELNFDPTSYTNMQEKISQIPNLQQYFLTIYIEEKSLLNDYEENLKQLYAETYHKYKFPKQGDGIEFEYSLDTKNEIHLYVEGNKKFVEKSLIVQKQKLQVEFLDKSLQNIRDMQWALKVAIDQRKFFEGLN